MSKTQAELVAKFAAGVVDTGGKFATGVTSSSEPTGGIPLCALQRERAYEEQNCFYRILV
jgi:hypothetical protein